MKKRNILLALVTFVVIGLKCGFCLKLPIVGADTPTTYKGIEVTTGNFLSFINEDITKIYGYEGNWFDSSDMDTATIQAELDDNGQSFYLKFCESKGAVPNRRIPKNGVSIYTGFFDAWGGVSFHKSRWLHYDRMAGRHSAVTGGNFTPSIINILAKNNPDLSNLLERSFQTGLNILYANEYFNTDSIYYSDGKKDTAAATGQTYDISGIVPLYVYNELMNSCSDGANCSRKWIDHVQIIIPPTTFTWGFAIRYNEDNVYSWGFEMAPLGLLGNDLIADFETMPSNAFEGDDVTVGVHVVSTFSNDISPSFEWDIKKADGTPVDSVTYLGAATTRTGRLGINGDREKLFYATFKMPSSNVDIQFEINSDRTIDEISYGNNKASSMPYGVKYLPPPPVSTEATNIPYNVLTRKFGFDLFHDKTNSIPIFANATKPRGTWYSDTTGKLTVFNNSEDILRSFSINNYSFSNTYDSYEINIIEGDSYVERIPDIRTTIRRQDFGDDPVGKNWLPLSNTPKIVVKDANTTASGSVQKTYVYYCDSELCTSEHYATSVPSFNGANYVLPITAYVYNGFKKLPFEKHIDVFSNGNTTKNIAWEGTHYLFDVYRWMCHLDENNAEYGWTKVGGQNKREFIGQSTGSIKWDVVQSMKQNYQTERKNAKDRLNGSNYYPNVVFATDKELQKHDYPIKSGYYFNPLGTYTCTIETQQYKDSPNNTAEHKELVDNIKAAFKFNSNLEYIDSNRLVYKLIDVSESNPCDLLKITENYEKSTVQLITATERNNPDTDKLFREVLEGYSDSETQGSVDNYEYREFVTSQKIYEVKEQTVITFTIKPTAKVYTHVNMPNGEYEMRVSVGEFNLEDAQSFTLDKNKDKLKVQTITNIDNINIAVRGSIYSDQN